MYPRARAPHADMSCLATSASSRPTRAGTRPTFTPTPTSPTRPPSATPIGRSTCARRHRLLARALRRGCRDDPRVGTPPDRRRARRHGGARRPGGRQCELIEERFTLIAPDDYRGTCSRSSYSGAGSASWRGSRCTRGTRARTARGMTERTINKPLMNKSDTHRRPVSRATRGKLGKTVWGVSR